MVRHPRARRMTLRVGPAGVRVTVPPRTPAREVDAFVRGHRDWIASRMATLPAPPPLRDGDRVAYLDGDLTLRVRSGARTGAREVDDELRVTVSEGRMPEAVVEAWYRRRAREVLGAMAAEHAAALGVRVAGIAIRDPRSRWGSCSAAGRLSLSWRLLLAPRAIADHVVAHEVCHLRHLDHSRAFWDLLAAVDPGRDAHRAWLRRHGPALALGPRWRRAAGAAGGDVPPGGAAGPTPP